MKSIGLSDGSFPHQASATMGSVNSHLGPVNFAWDRDGKVCQGYKFFTDMHIDKVTGHNPGKNVAWLLEPPSLSKTHYNKTEILADYFDYVLSFWLPYLEQFGEKGLFYPLGGSWIPSWTRGIHEKSRNVVLIASQKRRAIGHQMRHTAVKRFAHTLHIDVFGRGYMPFEDKGRILSPYRYAIIIESWKGADYFSEKLIDALSVGCVPIYWGCPNISDYFVPSGIIKFDTLDGLKHIMTDVVSPYDYEMRMSAIRENFVRCSQYYCAEDWIYEHYGFLFS